MKLRRMLLPWKGTLVPPTLHVAFTAGWGLLTAGGWTLGAWQLVAWPLLAGLALVTMSPLLYFLLRKRATFFSRLTLFALGASLSAIASFVFLHVSLDVGFNVLLVWMLAFSSAAAFELVFASPGLAAKS